MNPFETFNELFGIGYKGDLKTPWEKAAELEKKRALESATPEVIMDRFAADAELIARSVGTGDIETTFGSRKELGSNAFETSITILQIMIAGFKATVTLLPDETSYKVETTLKKVSDLIKRYIPSFEKLGDAFDKRAKDIGKSVDEATELLSKKNLMDAMSKLSDALEKVKKIFKKDNNSEKKADKDTSEKKTEKSSNKVADKAAASQDTISAAVPFNDSSIPEWMKTGLGSGTPSQSVEIPSIIAENLGNPIPKSNPLEQIFSPVEQQQQVIVPPAAIPNEIIAKYHLNEIAQIAANVGVKTTVELIPDLQGNPALIFVRAWSKIDAYIPDKSFIINIASVIDGRTGIWPCGVMDPNTFLPLEMCNVVYSLLLTETKEKDGKKERSIILNSGLIEVIFKFGFSGIPEDANKKEWTQFASKILATNRRFTLSSIPNLKDKKAYSQIKGALIRTTALIDKDEKENNAKYGRFAIESVEEVKAGEDVAMKFTLTNVGQGFFMCPPFVTTTPVKLEFTPKIMDGKFVPVSEGKSDIKYDIVWNFDVNKANVA